MSLTARNESIDFIDLKPICRGLLSDPFTRVKQSEIPFVVGKKAQSPRTPPDISWNHPRPKIKLQKTADKLLAEI